MQRRQQRCAMAAGGHVAAAQVADHVDAGHGREGEGMTGPNLTDDVWLHGWGVDAITKMINEGKNNVMPAQNALLTEQQIHVLASYVWGLSNKPKQ